MGNTLRGCMTSTSDRVLMIELVKEAVDNGARQHIACGILGITERTLQRWRDPSTAFEDQRPLIDKPSPLNKLTAEETMLILETVNKKEFQSLPPSQIVPALVDQGTYIASESSFYRVMHDADMQNHRSRAQKPSSKPKSTFCATAPNQVWTWDITYLPGPIKGLFYYLYLIIDIFSRDIMGWEIWDDESAEHASHLISKATLAQGTRLQPDPLVLHSDNGSPMKGATMLQTLYDLGITPSRSRPRVSNDNPYSESMFRTCKYRPEYPAKGFKSKDEARQWMLDFSRWYRFSHHHSGIKFLTPYQVHSGKAFEILENRKQVYATAKELHPRRWSRHTRNWTLKKEVWLNPEKTQLENSSMIEMNST